ncbi:hypothetical protein HPP92_011527 [Vanilla planifolia]|uniref:adenylate dimethylallyltransferase (ADP/ATP-dependent) n=1 Tax=Vanilla planifolia TaxID=51239 RepID=A0A835V3K8_VANPL|nr:hypothetical protein HPP92_011815 [Vanilla planifolia]KAG0483443.1 hypothetical protein HPP92_011527 [Vanilla planifolia]
MASLLCHNKAVFLPREPAAIRFRRDHALYSSDDNKHFYPFFPVQPLSSTKHRAIFVLGSSGTGKSKLAIDLARRFDGEVVNSDKMQVYDGLCIITNKVTLEESVGVPHHLLGGVHPDADFSAADFRRAAIVAADEISARGRLPIIAGGSNSYIKELVAGDNGAFARRYDCCFIWVDVDYPVLDDFVAERVDSMVEQGLVEEARELFVPAADYTKGIRRSIGVPEMDRFLRRESEAGEAEKAEMLADALDKIKANTCKLTRVQREKIQRFEAEDGWRLHRVDATLAVLRRREPVAGRVWEERVVVPSVEVVRRFFGGIGVMKRCGGVSAGDAAAVAAIAVVGATK